MSLIVIIQYDTNFSFFHSFNFYLKFDVFVYVFCIESIFTMKWM